MNNVKAKSSFYGIVRFGHHLNYGFGFGYLLGWPEIVKDWIVSVWNILSCCIYGHSYLVKERPDSLPVCTACLRHIKHPKTEPIHGYDDQ